MINSNAHKVLGQQYTIELLFNTPFERRINFPNFSGIQPRRMTRYIT